MDRVINSVIQVGNYIVPPFLTFLPSGPPFRLLPDTSSVDALLLGAIGTVTRRGFQISHASRIVPAEAASADMNRGLCVTPICFATCIGMPLRSRHQQIHGVEPLQRDVGPLGRWSPCGR